MKIFVIPSSYKNECNIQANIFVHEQCEQLIKRGHQVIVLDATTRSAKHWNHRSCTSPTFRKEGVVPVYSYCVRGIAKSRLPRLATLQFRNKVKVLWDIAVENEGMPDVIYAHFSFPSGFCALDLAKKFNIPIATMEHGGMYFNEKIHPYIIKQLCSTVSISDSFFCVSSSHSKRISELTNLDKNVEVVPNMISDIFSYTPLLSNDRFVFFSGGNLKPVKCFDLLVSAFCKAFDASQPVELRIAGEGEEREKIEKLIKDNGRDRQISLLGRLDRNDMLAEYKKCNCFALASVHESFGIVYREAMSCGRPVISTDNGGIREGWDDSFGIIVPIGDVEALSKAMTDLYENYSDYNLQDISKKTLDYCSQSSVVNIIESKLLRIVGEKNGF